MSNIMSKINIGEYYCTKNKSIVKIIDFTETRCVGIFVKLNKTESILNPISFFGNKSIYEYFDFDRSENNHNWTYNWVIKSYKFAGVNDEDFPLHLESKVDINKNPEYYL